CASGSSLSATPFNTANINTSLAANQTAFGAASAAELGGIIDWVRGKDNIEDENANFSWTDVRASVHGDIIHSRPAVINYNRYSTTTVTDNEDVVAFYGSNDGLFRAVKGGTDASDGYEKWAFIPQELFGKLKRLRDNSPLNTLPPTDTKPKDYFMDGPIGIYQKDANNDGKLVANDGDKVELFIGMRRGGRFIYALDVSNPDDPKLLWKKGCFGSPATCDAGYAELGQTWSEPKLATILDTDGVSKKTVLIFGAGYDAAVEDQDPIPTSGAGATNTVGRGIFVVDAANGNVIWQAGPSPTGATYNKTVSSMTYSIPSDIALLDRNSNGFIDRAYVGDTGGNVWRVDLGDGDPGQWQVNKLASVGYAASATAGNRRKFLYPPDVVASSDPNGAFDAVLTGTGDREHPLQGLGDTNHPTGNAVANSYYMFKDRSTGSTFTGNGSGPSGTIVAADLFDVTNNATGAQSVPASDKGWVLNLAAAEKVVASSTTLAGATYFNTHQPTFPGPGSCGTLGQARLYTIDFQNGAAFNDTNGNGNIEASDRYYGGSGGNTLTGLPSSPVAAIVPLKVVNGQTVIMSGGGQTTAKPDGQKQVVCQTGTHCIQAPGAFGERIRTWWQQLFD
ncbi:MAG: PilC/PilY family type IV pilus protein, partial [Pseudomonadota bacterium]|nr:PilC/PilY family type IV pilus protein [Pseudomonadota bacterium]